MLPFPGEKWQHFDVSFWNVSVVFLQLKVFWGMLNPK